MNYPTQPPAWQPPPPRQVSGRRKLKIAGIGCGSLLLLFLVIGIIGAIVDPVKTPAAAARSAATASPSPATTTTASPSPTPSVAVIPALTGVTVDIAFATAAHQGYATTAALRSGATLPGGVLSDFLVCAQAPDSGTPGTPGTGNAIKLTVADTAAGESCTGPTYSPTPSSTPSPTPSPTVRPKPKPKPRPKPTQSPTHSRSSTSGGSSGGSVSDPGNGATALCNDGTYSYAAHHQGACSHHHGVAVFYK